MLSGKKQRPQVAARLLPSPGLWPSLGLRAIASLKSCNRQSSLQQNTSIFLMRLSPGKLPEV